MTHLTPEEQHKQERYRDARSSKKYDGIWQSVGKCVFCDLRDKYIVREENGIVLTITLYAYIDGHMMIIPRRHVHSAKELTPQEWETIRKFTYLAKKMIKQVHGIKGMQLVQKDGAEAQSTVEHIHFHAIPFDAPDLCQWNYRTLANTPLENVALYKAEQKTLDKLAEKFDEKYVVETAGKATPDAKPAMPEPGNDEPNKKAANPFAFQWSDLAFSSKKPVNRLNATFIFAPRELTARRFTQLVKTYLPKGNIVLGISDEPYVLGFENQPQFKMLRTETVQPVIDKVNAASNHKIYLLHYPQRDIVHVLGKLDFQKVVLANGSWKQTFHTLPAYYTIVNRKVSYDMVSPFADEAEAHEYEAKTSQQIIKNFATVASQLPAKNATLQDAQLLDLAQQAAKQSYDYSFQTGVVLAQKIKTGYKPLLSAFNKVVPYQTYAMHHGASREQNFSPPNDLNHYDAVHAEVELLVQAGKQGIDLKNTTLFINLLPCPSCARMLAETDIAEFVYQFDHSEGYALQLLEKAGKKVRRLVTGDE